ncbi:MAG: hypothetical protein WEC59_02670, partial [Salibacteraceae bacterium]
MKTVKLIIMMLLSGPLFAQTSEKKIKMGVLTIESHDLIQDADAIGKMARLKMQRTDGYTVFREHDVKALINNDEIDFSNCYSIKCLTEVGQKLGADQMLSGSAERFGERIVINLIIVDVHKNEIIASDVTEYYNLGGELEGMIEISVNNLLGLESDALLLNGLVKKERTLSDQVVERLKLNGPRMGFTYVSGLRGQRLQDSENNNGFGMFPVMSQFGYQFEWQYLSAGNLQALVEVIPMIGGMDQQAFIPSVTFMNGFRHSRSGIEFAFGPTLRLTRVAHGFYDQNNEWQRASEYDEDQKQNYKSDLHENIDSRGSAKVEYGFTVAAGKTIQSGHLNIPINVFYSPGKYGGLIGASFGFNIRKR